MGLLKRSVCGLAVLGIAASVSTVPVKAAGCTVQATVLETRKSTAHSRFGEAFQRKDRSKACEAVTELLGIVDQMSDLVTGTGCTHWTPQQLHTMRDNIRYNGKQFDCENRASPEHNGPGDNDCETVGPRLNQAMQAAWRRLDTKDVRLKCAATDDVLGLADQLEELGERCVRVNKDKQVSELKRIRNDMGTIRDELRCGG